MFQVSQNCCQLGIESLKCWLMKGCFPVWATVALSVSFPWCSAEISSMWARSASPFPLLWLGGVRQVLGRTCSEWELWGSQLGSIEGGHWPGAHCAMGRRGTGPEPRAGAAQIAEGGSARSGISECCWKIGRNPTEKGVGRGGPAHKTEITPWTDLK